MTTTTVRTPGAPAVDRRRATRAERRQLRAAGYDLPDILITEVLADGSRRWTSLHRVGPCDCRSSACPRPSRSRGSIMTAHTSAPVPGGHLDPVKRHDRAAEQYKPRAAVEGQQNAGPPPRLFCPDCITPLRHRPRPNGDGRCRRCAQAVGTKRRHSLPKTTVQADRTMEWT